MKYYKIIVGKESPGQHEMKEVNKMTRTHNKNYIVCWLENDIIKTKTYKTRKSAEKFGVKVMMENDVAVNIATYYDGELVSNDWYN